MVIQYYDDYEKKAVHAQYAAMQNMLLSRLSPHVSAAKLEQAEKNSDDQKKQLILLTETEVE